MTSRTPSNDGISYEGTTVGGIAGVWCLPKHARPKAAMLFIHGGAYVLGSAGAYQNFAGQLAARCNVMAFVVDYRLAPEHPFPRSGR